ncbi:MAG: isochorismatase family protein [Syntrophomonadaceae bacterium]|jgi:nicotinamidase-related amidase
MNKYRLDSNNCVLMVIDIQERLMQAMNRAQQVYKNGSILLAAAREFNIPVILTEQYPKGLGPTVREIADNLPQEYFYLEKVEFSGYIPQLIDYLNKLGRQQIILIGSETHVCVFQTARDLQEAGFTVHLARDAVCSRFDENYLNGLELIKDSGAVITNTETIVFDLLKVAGTPQFKNLSRLVK